MVKVGLIGCGHWGPNHIRNFNSLPNATVKSCADLEEERLVKMRTMFPGIQTTTDYNDILNDSEIDAVVVATPTGTHFDITRKALNSKKDVLCEKPLTISLDESKELVKLSEKNDRILMVGHVFLFNAGIQKLYELIQEGVLGKIYYIHCSRTNLGPIRSDVNVVYDLASHDIYICSYLLGNSYPTGVIAKGEDFLQPKIEDVAFISLSFPGKILANIHVSWIDPKKIRQITVVGDKKMAIWSDLDNEEPIKIFDKGVLKEPYYDNYGEFRLITREGDINSPKINLTEPLRGQSIHFVECVEKRIKPICDGESGYKVVEVLEKVQNALKNIN